MKEKPDIDDSVVMRAMQMSADIMFLGKQIHPNNPGMLQQYVINRLGEMRNHIQEYNDLDQQAITLLEQQTQMVVQQIRGLAHKVTLMMGVSLIKIKH